MQITPLKSFFHPESKADYAFSAALHLAGALAVSQFTPLAFNRLGKINSLLSSKVAKYATLATGTAAYFTTKWLTGPHANDKAKDKAEDLKSQIAHLKRSGVIELKELQKLIDFLREEEVEKEEVEELMLFPTYKTKSKDFTDTTQTENE